MKREKQISIRVKPNVLELADNYKKTTGYSRADIFELGTYILDDSQSIDLIMEEKIINEVLKIHKTIREEVKKLDEHISEQIESLENRKIENKKKSLNVEYDSTILDETIDDILSIVNRRKENIKYGIYLEPMGLEFFELKCQRCGVPVDFLLKKLEENGYGVEFFDDVNISVKQHWRGYSEMSKESLV